MKRITNIFLGIVATLTFMSCNDFLDQKINDNYDEEMFLHSGFNNLKAWGLGAYNYLRPYNGLDGGASLAAACDDQTYKNLIPVPGTNFPILMMYLHIITKVSVTLIYFSKRQRNTNTFYMKIL